MPRVPTYHGDRIQSRPVSSTKAGPAPDPAAYGAEFGATLQRVAVATLEQRARIRQEEQQRATERLATIAERQFNQLEEVYGLSDDKGLFKQTGKQPSDNLQAYKDTIDEQMAEIVGQARTPEQQVLLETMRARRRASFFERMDKHAYDELRTYDKNEATAAITSSSLVAIGSAGTPDYQQVISDQLARLDGIIRVNGARQGLGPDAIQAAIDDQHSKVHVGVIDRLLSKDRAEEAQRYFETNKDGISGDVRDDVENKLKVQVGDVTAFQASEEIWAVHVPRTLADDAAVPIDAMEAAARAQFASQPKVYQQTIAYLREKKAGFDAGRRERSNARDSAIWGSIVNGATLTQVRQLEAYRLADGSTRQAVATYFQREAEHAESVARARTAEAFATIQRTEAIKELEGAAEFWTLMSDPQRLRDMPTGKILNMLPKLGKDYVGQLIKEQQDLKRTSAAVRNAVVDRTWFKDRAAEAGMSYVYKTPAMQSDDEKGRIGSLFSAVRGEMIRRQERLNRPLNEDEKEQVMDDIVGRRVMIDVPFAFDYEVITATMKQDEVGRAYVPLETIEQVAPQAVIDMINHIRMQPIRAGVTDVSTLGDDEIKRRYRNRMQRAYARAVIGGDPVTVNRESQAILDEQVP
jgi:hypothetical protein